jgi:glycosyltransferase involved in cell wall biosynthesis
VSTRPDGGIGGGIPSALVGYINGLDAKGISYQIVESHTENKFLLISWLNAFWKILLLSIQHKKNVVFWFHMGPWLSITRKFSLALIPRLFGCKNVAHIHSPKFNDYLTRSSLSKVLVRFSLLPFNQVVVLSSWWENLLIEHKIMKKIMISPNPNNDFYCEIARAFKRKPRKIGITKNIYHILTMARLVEGKGVDLVISALARLPNTFQLTIAGDGLLKKQLMKQAETLGVHDRVMFTGWVNGKEKDDLLRNADIFCLPSSYDSFGMVFIEAMAYDLPIVAYGWGPIKDVVTEDVGCCCLKPTVEAVSDNILKVSALLVTYQNKGPQRVLRYYTPEVITRNIVRLLD